MIQRKIRYRGRFAPTPSGPLHLGSLMTALASWLQARSHNGAWLLRVDDLDQARCPAGTDAVILRQLEAHGLVWDEAARYQTAHLAEYQEALETLRRSGLLYACRCTREALRRGSLAGPDGAVYAGTCRDAARAESRASLRLRVAAGELCFDDGCQGRQCRSLATAVGDFVVRRADGVIAYQLACAVDEAAQAITEVVRGADLLGSTFRQLAVQRALGLRAPGYRHLPVLTDARGRKLSKQNHAAPIHAAHASRNLFRCLELLGQAPDPALRDAAVPDLLRWAITNWSAAKIRGSAAIPSESGP